MKRKEANFWPGQASQADRRRARENICLTDVGVTEGTLQRYYYAVSRLAPILEVVNTEFELDTEIAEWIQQEFEDGCPLHLVGDALSGLHHLDPCTRKKSRAAGAFTEFGGNLKSHAGHLPFLRTYAWPWRVGVYSEVSWSWPGLSY